MSSAHEPDGQVPGWFVTFADMTSLLLAFFVLLHSMHETGRGPTRNESATMLAPKRPVEAASRQQADVEPVDPVLRYLLAKGWGQRDSQLRAIQLDQADGGEPDGRDADVDVSGRIPIPIRSTATIEFADESAALTEPSRDALRRISRSARRLAGQWPTIEIRADHLADASGTGGDRPSMDLARCATILDFLVRDGQVPEDRCRLSIVPVRSAAGPPPAHADHESRINSVDVILSAAWQTMTPR